MKYTVKLDQKDIIDIIRRHFGCIDPESVQLELRTTAEDSKTGFLDPKTGFLKAGLNVGARVEFERGVYAEIQF